MTLTHMCTGKPANPRGLVTLYCWGRSFHSTAEAWDWTCTVSEVLLYSPVLIIKMQETSMNSLNKTLMITSKYVVSASFCTLKKKKKNHWVLALPLRETSWRARTMYVLILPEHGRESCGAEGGTKHERCQGEHSSCPEKLMHRCWRTAIE